MLSPASNGRGRNPVELHAHEHTPLIIEHPSVRPLVLDISDDEFRTGRVARVPPPPLVPVFEDLTPRKRSFFPAIIAGVAVAVLVVISISARLAEHARDTRPSVAQAAETPAAVVESIAPPIVTAPRVLPTAPTPSVTVKQPASAPRALAVAKPARLVKPSPAPAAKPPSGTPYGIDDPGF